MGRRLCKRGWRPHRVISSPAIRARTTAGLLAAEIGYPDQEISLEPDIYEASSDRLLEMIRSFPEAWERIALVGHNPGFTELAEQLSGKPFGNVPTCGVIQLSYRPVSWAEAVDGCCDVVFYDYPKHGAGA